MDRRASEFEMLGEGKVSPLMRVGGVKHEQKKGEYKINSVRY